MAPLTRIPLASLVCPSAPFLAPRLLRATVSCTAAAAAAAAAVQPSQRALSSTPRCCDNAAKGKKSGRSYFLEMRKRQQQQARRNDRRGQDQDADAELPAAVVQLAAALQTACQQRDLQQLMDLYPAALEAGIVGSDETHIICQALHAAVRRHMAPPKERRPLDALLLFANELVGHLQQGALPPHHFAYVHLLGIYKETRRFADGHRLWQWLSAQGDAHVSQAAYGAAIELLTLADLMPLPQLEALYHEGLKRFPGTFAEYHLSSDAIVPDRTQPVHIAGLPTTMLQGIVTARLRARDWKNAYLGLDTILRLFPAQTPPRFFNLFVGHRPLREAYTAYLLACRSGVRLPSSVVTALLTRLSTAMPGTPLLSDRFKLLRAMANALYAYQQCGRGLDTVHVGQFVKAFEYLLPEKTPGQDFPQEESLFRDTIAATAHECVVSLLHSGLPVGVQPFLSLVTLSGKLRLPELLKQTLEDAKTAGVTFHAIERRTLLGAAGLLQDPSLVKAVWQLIVGDAEAHGTQLSYSDWATFAKACRHTDLREHFEQQLQEQAHSITTSIETRVRAIMSEADLRPVKSTPLDMTPERFHDEIKSLQGQLENIKTVLMSGQPLDMQKSPFYMHIDPEQPPLGSEQDLRDVYNDLTTDPHQPVAPASASSIAPALSTTGVPLDQVRFHNWVTVHEMMASASAATASRRDTIDKAVSERRSLKSMPEHPFSPSWPTAESKIALRARIAALRTTFRFLEPPQPDLSEVELKRKIRTHVSDSVQPHETWGQDAESSV